MSLILAICICAFLAFPGPLNQPASTLREKALTFLKSLGALLATLTLLGTLLSLGEVKPASSFSAFRKGQLVPRIEESNDSQYVTPQISYIEKIWWGWKESGNWIARPKDFETWEYLGDDGTWSEVPRQIYDNVEDDRQMEVDNRGWHEAD